MSYRFATDRADYSDLASGHVLLSAPGRTGFPVRLATEIFQRAAAHLAERERPAPWAVLDPCCGAGQLLTTVGLLHRAAIRSLSGTDIDPEAVAMAARNLDLLAPGGMARREAELRTAAIDSGRSGLAAAADAADRLRRDLDRQGDLPPLELRTAAADTTDLAAVGAVIPVDGVDLVLADVPYGNWSEWRSGRDDSGAAAGMTPLDQMLGVLIPALAPGAVVAIASDKAQRPRHPLYRRLEWWQVGHRRVELLSVD